jgi:hypothetical protein
MAKLPRTANTEENNAQMGIQLLPEGEYMLMIVKSDMKTTKDGEGKYLQLDMKITDGPYQGRNYVERLNLINENSLAVNIAEQTLNTICESCGLSGVDDSVDLHNIEMRAFMKIRKAKPGSEWGDSNYVSMYRPVVSDQPFSDVDED